MTVAPHQPIQPSMPAMPSMSTGAHGTDSTRDPALDARARLVRGAAAGDRAALSDLWHDSRRWVAAILLAHAPRSVTAGGQGSSSIDDLLQAVALQMVRKIHQVRDPEAFRPWLRAVAINVARAEGRALGRKLDTVGPQLRLVGDEADTGSNHSGSTAHDAAAATTAAPAASGRASPGASDEARRVLELARELPEAYREPLLLRCARGMSYTQISAVLDLPETTIETRIARGRRMLRERLAHQDRSEPIKPSEQNTHTVGDPITTPGSGGTIS